MEETVEQIEARLKRAYVTRATPEQYAASKADMLHTSRAAEIGKMAQRDTSNVVGLSDADYEKRKRGMLRASLYSRTR